MSKLELPEYGKHIVFLGTTGSGKSQMAQALLPYYEKYLVIDTQDSIDLEGKRVREPDKLGRMLVNPLIETDRILYVPKPPWQRPKLSDDAGAMYHNRKAEKNFILDQ
jgi:energy-coupling factor transporter ATP-binding protein EcfA2